MPITKSVPSLDTKVVILGGGESGVGAAVLAKVKGYDVFLSDAGIVKVHYKEELDKHQIPFEEGQHDENRILQAGIIIKSPGIPDSAPLIMTAMLQGISIISEIEWAGLFTNATCIAITGTNGKTTTASLTHHMLKEAGLNVGLAGNIGRSFARSVAEDHFDYYVLELSSFQLDGIKDMNTHVSVLLNITPDHLDRYDNRLDLYIKSKFQITKNQTSKDFFIYNIDDELITKHLNQFQTAAVKLPISLNSKVFPGAYIKENTLHIGLKQENEIVMSIEETNLMGRHNRYNSMAASLSSRIMDVRKDTIRESLKSFKNVEHRLEKVAIINGITFINDSKATNVNSAWFALESISGNIIWIAGGLDHDNDYEQLAPMVREKVKVMVCIGKDNTNILNSLSSIVPKVEESKSMHEAVATAYSFASEGDTILLAPACKSFDLFMNYEDRGRQFKNAVLSI